MLSFRLNFRPLRHVSQKIRMLVVLYGFVALFFTYVSVLMTMAYVQDDYVSEADSAPVFKSNTYSVRHD